MKKYILAILTLGIGLTTMAQSTQKLTATKASEYGIIYSLPQTVIDITIEIERTVKKPGEYYQYAKKYLNTSAAITTYSEEVKLKSITVVPRGVANSKEQYLMQFKSGSTPFLILNEENVPLALNTENIPGINGEYMPMAVSSTPTPLETNAAKHVISSEIAQSQSSAKRAELAASQLFALRQTRQDILTGEAEQMPADGKAMELVLNNIQLQEDALWAMFNGTTQTSTLVKTITYNLDEEVDNDVLARISSSDGVIDADNLAGMPIYISVDVIKKGELPMTEKGTPKTFPKGGVAYVIPGKVSVKIDCDGVNYYNKDINTAQHGVVFGLDPKMFMNGVAPSYLLFDATTGAIKELGAVKNSSK